MATAVATAARDYVSLALCYMEDVLDGTQVAGRLTRLACERQLRDLERAAAGDPGFPYVFDPAAAARICRFKESLPHIKGVWAQRRELITLEPWQVFKNTTLFGWRHAGDGTRRFRTAYEEVARKNAKSTEGAGSFLYLLCADGEPGAEVYCAATKKEQATVVFDTARNMALRSPALRARFGLEVQSYKMLVRAEDSVGRALDAKGSTQDGLNTHGLVNDELHAWKGRGLYEVLETSMGSRAQPLAINITTAGHDRSGICYELRAYGIRVLERKTDDESFFAVIYSIDDDDDWTDEACWPKANPNLGVSVYLRDMQIQAKQAKEQAAKLNGFLTKRLNVWTNASTAWMDMRKWAACEDPALRLADFAGEDCIGAVDLAVRKDICSRIMWFERGGLFYLFARHYVNRACVERGENAQYAGWERDGWLTVTEGDATDHKRILADLLEDAERIRFVEIVFDRYQAAMMMSELIEEGFTVVDLPVTVPMMSMPMKELELLVLDGKLRHCGDPVLGWMIANVTCRQDEKGNIFPIKETKNSSLKIDAAVAAIMGMNRLIAKEWNKPEPEYQMIFV